MRGACKSAAPVPEWAASFGALYADLRAAAHRVCGAQAHGTMQPTALLHEVYLRLSKAAPAINDTHHLSALCVRIMRQILVDRARRQTLRRTVARRDGARLAADMLSTRAPTPDEVLAIDEALTGLRTLDQRKADVFALRFFCAMTIDEVAGMLGVARSTVAADWRFARAWLADQLRESS